MKIGFLPLYVKLYDDKLPELRERLEGFYNDLAAMFEEKGVSVIKSDFCRLSHEFSAAVSMFEKNGADAIVTVHMAYSPSLECIDALSKTDLPIVVLDTTETLTFLNDQDPGEIMYCHGIHGVMDMCSMLTRRGKKYAIACGYYNASACIQEACGLVRAAISAKAVKSVKTGLIGGFFEGMGDFQVPFAELRNRFGIDVAELPASKMASYSASITDNEIDSEIVFDKANYDFSDNVIEAEYREATRSCLAVRKCIEEEGLSAFSINFTNMGAKSGLHVMPFLECCKAMERGIGYAGEGDVLTASFVSALLKGYDETNFVEIFCPDWKNNVMFLSHMGEINYKDADIKPCISRVGVNYSPGGFPYVGYTRMKGGKGMYVNISRGVSDYKIVATPATMLSFDTDNFQGAMRGWMQTECSSSDFLKNLSKHGATHHSIFVYGMTTEELCHFADILDLETVVI